MSRAPSRQQPFHWVLKTGLVGALVFCASIYAVKSVAVGFLLIALGVVFEVVTVPIAIYLLLRGGYRTMGNVVFTLVGAAPLLALVFVAFVLFLGHWHL